MTPGVLLHHPVVATVNSDAEINTEYNVHTDPTPFTAAAAMLRLFSSSHCLFSLEVDK